MREFVFLLPSVKILLDNFSVFRFKKFKNKENKKIYKK